MTATLLMIFITCCIVSIFFWRVIHPTLLRLVRFRLFARRDELRRLAIDGKEDHFSFAYREVEGFMCKTIFVVPSISLASFLLFVFRNLKTEPSSEMKRVRQEASERLISLLDESAKDAVVMMTLNSPILMFLGAIVALLLWLCSGFGLVYRRAEHFVNALPVEPYSGIAPQPA